MHYMITFLIFLAAACPVLNAAEALHLDIKTDPPSGLIKPNVDTTRLSVRMEDAFGRTVAVPTRFKIALDSPPRNAFFSTGFPIVEGTPLLRGEFNNNNGNLELDYLFPIRGDYRFRVVAESSLGHSEHEWNLKINEEPRAVRRFSLLMTLLSLFGIVSGIYLARSVRHRASGSVSASVVAALLLFAWPSNNSFAEDDHHHSHTAEITTSDSAIAESASGRVEIRLSPSFATVGNLATLSGEFKPNIHQDDPIEFTLSFVNLDHDHEVFRTHFTTPDGTFRLNYQFTDGAHHRVTVSARPASGTNAPAEAAMNVAVRAIQPPALIVARTLLFLIGVTTCAMVLGFAGALNFRKA